MKHPVSVLLVAWLLIGGLTPPTQASDKPPLDSPLTDPRDGKTITLAEWRDRKAIVVAFVGTECPVNNQYMPRLAEFAREYGPKGVGFLAVNSNVQDTPARVADHARKYAMPFPVVKDPGSRAADQFAARRTPEVVVLNSERLIVYRGRIDDQYGVFFTRPKPTRRDLGEALDDLLGGRKVALASTEVAGCLIARPQVPRGEARVTYTRNVASILQKHCQECHRPGQIGPMAFLTYEDATAWAETIREVVEEQRMPPWFADPKHGTFANDRRLPKEDRETLLAWVAAGCPKGEERDQPPPRTFHEGWGIGKPDAIFTMPEEYAIPATVGKNGVPYRYFYLDTNFEEDKWVIAAEARPGATEVVHHIIVFYVPPGEVYYPGGPGKVLVGTAPGDMPLVLPKGVAKKIPKGSKLVFQMHYTPNGKAQKDRSSVGLIFAKEPPQRSAFTVGVANPRLQIPAGADNHQVESQFTFREDGHLLGFMPHMHLRGKSFRYEAIFPDGKTELLLSVPNYNFNWQSAYRLAKPYPMPKGSKVRCVAHFDNSAKNPNNPDPTRLVRWGDQTWEEMMIGWIEFVFDKPAS